MSRLTFVHFRVAVTSPTSEAYLSCISKSRAYEASDKGDPRLF
jgi:hypothetical protein